MKLQTPASISKLCQHEDRRDRSDPTETDEDWVGSCAVQRGPDADIADEVIGDFRAAHGPYELLSVAEFQSRAKHLVRARNWARAA